MYVQRFENEQPDGSVAVLDWSFELQLPNIIMLPDFVKVTPDRRHDCLVWLVPADDTSHRAFFAVRATSPDRLMRIILGIKQNGKLFFELTEEEKQRFPGDFEAQGSQGPITQHSEETLATSDKTLVMLRRQLRQIVDDVEAGRDPQNAGPGDTAVRSTTSGVFTVGVKEAGSLAGAAAAPSADS
jgi:hypothetical protein